MNNKNQIYLLSGLVAVALLAVGVMTYTNAGGQEQVSARPAAKAADVVATAPTPPTPPTCVKTLRIAFQVRKAHAYRDPATQGFIDGLNAMGICVTETEPAPPDPLDNNPSKTAFDPAGILNNVVKPILADTKKFDAMITIAGTGTMPKSPTVTEQGDGLLADTFTSNLPFYMDAKQHIDWLFHGGGIEVEQGIANNNPLVGMDTSTTPHTPFVKILPVAMSAGEHGMFWKEPIPSTLEEAKTYFGPGKSIRFFGNGGRLASKVFGFTQYAVTGQTPYQLMVDNAVIGVDFTTPKGDLYDFFKYPGINILSGNTEWTCDTTIDSPATLNDLVDGTPYDNSSADPNGCPNVAELGYKNFYAKGWHQKFNVMDMAINNTFWMSLTPEQRSAIEALAEKNMHEGRMAEVQQNAEALQGIKAYLEDPAVGGTFINSPWPGPVLNHLKQEAEAYFESIAVADPNGFGKVLKSMKEFKPYSTSMKCPDGDTCVELDKDAPIKLASFLSAKGSAADPIGKDDARGLYIAQKIRPTLDGLPGGRPVQFVGSGIEDEKITLMDGTQEVKFPNFDDGTAAARLANAAAITNDPSIVGVLGTTTSGGASTTANIFSAAKYMMLSGQTLGTALTRDRLTTNVGGSGANGEYFARTIFTGILPSFEIAKRFCEPGMTFATIADTGNAAFTQSLTAAFAEKCGTAPGGLGATRVTPLTGGGALDSGSFTIPDSLTQAPNIDIWASTNDNATIRASVHTVLNNIKAQHPNVSKPAPDFIYVVYTDSKKAGKIIRWAKPKTIPALSSCTSIGNAFASTIWAASNSQMNADFINGMNIDTATPTNLHDDCGDTTDAKGVYVTISETLSNTKLDEFWAAYGTAFGSSVYNATRIPKGPTEYPPFNADAYNTMLTAIQKVAITNPSGKMLIPRVALKDAIIKSTTNVAGLTGTLNCNKPNLGGVDGQQKVGPNYQGDCLPDAKFIMTKVECTSPTDPTTCAFKEDHSIVVWPNSPIKVGASLRTEKARQVQRGVQLALLGPSPSYTPLTLAGHALQYVFKPDGCDENSDAVATASANGFISEKVTGVIGSTCSGRGATMNKVLAPLKVLMFSPSATRIAFTDPAATAIKFFARAFNDKAQGLTGVNFVNNQFKSSPTDIPQIVIIRDLNNTFPTGLANQFRDDFHRLNGNYTIRKVVDISCMGGTVGATAPTQINCKLDTAYATAIADVATEIGAGSIDLIYAPLAGPLEQAALTKAIKANRTIGTIPSMGGDAANVNDFITAAGTAAEGLFYASGAPAPSPDFTNLYKDNYTQEVPVGFPEVAYDETKILLNSINDNDVKTILPNNTLIIERQKLFDRLLNTTAGGKGTYAGYDGTWDCKNTSLPNIMVGDCLQTATLTVSEVVDCTVGTEGCIDLDGTEPLTKGLKFSIIYP